MKICLIALPYPASHKHQFTLDVVHFLAKWGAEVDVVYPEERAIKVAEVMPQHDLYVLKSRTEMALVLAGALHAAGARILNPYPVAALLADKITSTRLLQAAGVPVPETFVTARPQMLLPFLDGGPMAIKSFRGTDAWGVQVVWDSEELDEVPINEGPILAQRLVERRAHGRRISCIGGQLFGVSKVWPERTYEDRVGQAFTITPQLRDIAIRCGRAFGIDLYGLDIIGDDDHPYVVDIRSFPSFKGVPDAALRLADYIYHAAQLLLDGQPMLPQSLSGSPP